MVEAVLSGVESRHPEVIAVVAGGGLYLSHGIVVFAA